MNESISAILQAIDDAIKCVTDNYSYVETVKFLDEISKISQKHLAELREKEDPDKLETLIKEIQEQERGVTDMTENKLSPQMQNLQTVIANLKGPFDYMETAERLDQISKKTQEQLADKKYENNKETQED